MPDGRDEADNGKKRARDEKRDEYRNPDSCGAYDGMPGGDVGICSGSFKHRSVSLRGGDELQIVIVKLGALRDVRGAVPADSEVLHGYPDACLIAEIKAEALQGLVGATEPY